MLRAQAGHGHLLVGARFGAFRVGHFAAVGPGQHDIEFTRFSSSRVVRHLSFVLKSHWMLTLEQQIAKIHF